MTTAETTPQTLVIERVFAHPPEKLWRALTESTLLAQWLMKNDFEPVLGRAFQFRSDPVPNWDGVIDCEVTVIEPLRQLSYSWKTMGATFSVLWTLHPADGGTQVRVEQSGFGANQQAYQGAKYGWNKFLTNLESIVAKMEN